jgi:hypothetical protein
MALRNGWKFRYTVKDLLDASTDRVAYHGDRLTFWREERDRTIELAKQTGVQVREHQVTGGKRADLVVDVTLGARLHECDGKIDKHEKLGEEYGVWEDVLGAMPPDQVYDLDAQDVLFFALTKSGMGEEETSDDD